MLKLTVPSEVQEVYNEKTSKFQQITVDAVPVTLEHSLHTVSMWEAKYKKPFMSDLESHKKTDDEMTDYVRMMVLDEISDAIFTNLLQYNLKEVNDYIADPHTATTVKERKQNSGVDEMVTAEVIYYWMFSSQIPLECEHWHLNKLMMLIRVFAAKNAKPEKMSTADIAARNRELNAQRRAKMKSKG